MKEIRDERIELQTLKNIQFAFIVQSAGIVGIMIFYLITDGILAFIKNPLWMLFMVITIILSYQNLKIEDDIHDETTNPGSYYRVVLYAAIFGVLTGLVQKFFPGDSEASAILVGLIVFGCFLVPFSIAYFLLKRRYEKNSE